MQICHASGDIPNPQCASHNAETVSGFAGAKPAKLILETLASPWQLIQNTGLS